MWIHQIELALGEQHSLRLYEPRAYLRSIHGSLETVFGTEYQEKLGCGDCAFLQEEQQVRLTAKTATRALVIDIPV